MSYYFLGIKYHLLRLPRLKGGAVVAENEYLKQVKKLVKGEQNMMMQIIVAQAPILPPDVIKHLFEANKKYRVYFLQRKEDEGTSKYFKYKNSNGQLTEMYYEEFLNGRWVYREEIPHNAFVEFLGPICEI